MSERRYLKQYVSPTHGRYTYTRWSMSKSFWDVVPLQATRRNGNCFIPAWETARRNGAYVNMTLTTGNHVVQVVLRYLPLMPSREAEPYALYS